MVIRPCGVRVEDNKVLTMRYSYGGRDRFNLPGGGVEEGDELVVATLHREFREELGVEITVGDLLFTAETRVHNRHVFHMIFHITKIIGTPSCHRSMTKAIEVVWLPLESLAQETLYPAIGPEIKFFFLSGHPAHRRIHLGALDQPWFE